MPDGAATRTGIWKTSRPSSATPASCAPPPVRMMPAGSIPTPAARISLRISSKVSRIRASMIWQTSSRLTVRPASSPRTDTLISSSSTIALRSHVPWRDLELLGDLEAGLEPDRDVVGDVRAADRQHPGVERRAVLEEREVDGAGTDVGDRDTELLLRRDQDRLGRGERIDHQLVDLDARLGDALGQVLDRRRRRGDDVGLDLELEGAHPERVLDPLLAVDRETPSLDVEDVAVGRDGHRPGDLDRAVDVLAGDLAMVRRDRDLAVRVEALDVLAADADEGPVDLPAGQPLGPLDGVGDRADRLVDVDDDALLEARTRARCRGP